MRRDKSNKAFVNKEGEKGLRGKWEKRIKIYIMYRYKFHMMNVIIMYI